MEDKIKKIIEGIRPYLQSDGGDVEFIKYADGYVFVKLIGACQHCLYSDETIKNGLLETLKAEIPEIIDVIKVDL